MRNVRKIISALLVFVLAFSMLSVSAFAVGETVTVIFRDPSANGGTVYSEQVIPVGGTFAVPTPTREGYRLYGWTCFGESYTNEYVIEHNTTKVDIEFVATWWQEGKYMITFEGNGGTVEFSKAQTLNTGKLDQSSSIPDAYRDYYIFNGWFTSPTGGTQITDDTLFTGDDTVYAQWTYSSTPVERTYRMVNKEYDEGFANSNVERAAEGETVTVSAVANHGYHVDSMKAVARNGEELTLTDNGDGTYSFEMPAFRVTLFAYFSECPLAKYTDLDPTAEYHDAVEYNIEQGLMNGTSADSFDPTGNLTRAMVATMLWRLEGGPDVEYTGIFEDVKDGVWYSDAIEWAYSKGLVNGVSETTFSPNVVMPREQVATLMWRYAGSPAAEYDVSGIADFDTVSSWAKDAIKWAVANGILELNEGSTVCPREDAIRTHIALAVYKTAVV